MRILIIEDHDSLRLAIAQRLREDSYLVDDVAEGGRGLQLCGRTNYPLILLDLRLPDVDGLSVLSELRQRGSDACVLILTARDSIADRVQALDAGADDYLIKPFSMEELMARVRALVRRCYGIRGNLLVLDDLEIDTYRRRVRRGGRVLDLTVREFALLEVLALRRGTLVTREEIWGYIDRHNRKVVSNVVDVYIVHLRRKVDLPGLLPLIHTRRGEGYVLALPEELGRAGVAGSGGESLAVRVGP